MDSRKVCLLCSTYHRIPEVPKMKIPWETFLHVYPLDKVQTPRSSLCWSMVRESTEFRPRLRSQIIIVICVQDLHRVILKTKYQRIIDLYILIIVLCILLRVYQPIHVDYGICLCTYWSNGSVDIYGNCLWIFCITNYLKMATNRGRNM
jgi:hypothetical protein